MKLIELQQLVELSEDSNYLMDIAAEKYKLKKHENIEEVELSAVETNNEKLYLHLELTIINEETEDEYQETLEIDADDLEI